MEQRAARADGHWLVTATPLSSSSSRILAQASRSSSRARRVSSRSRSEPQVRLTCPAACPTEEREGHEGGCCLCFSRVGRALNTSRLIVKTPHDATPSAAPALLPATYFPYCSLGKQKHARRNTAAIVRWSRGGRSPTLPTDALHRNEVAPRVISGTILDSNVGDVGGNPTRGCLQVRCGVHVCSPSLALRFGSTPGTLPKLGHRRRVLCREG